MDNDIKIKIRDLNKSFGNNQVLNGVNLNIKAGSSLVVLGSSGSGKSVLIKTIIGLLSSDQGSVDIDGVETSKLSRKERFKLMEKCGFLFQSSALFDSLTVQENIIFFAQRLKQLSLTEKRELAEMKLASVGMSPEILTLYPSELSGGMQKRVSLARAICTNPEIIFFDEPTTGLDPIMANVINELIIKVRKELGATIITITHDMNSANTIATDVAMLLGGKIIWEGGVKELNNTTNPYMVQFINGRTEGPISV